MKPAIMCLMFLLLAGCNLSKLPVWSGATPGTGIVAASDPCEHVDCTNDKRSGNPMVNYIFDGQSAPCVHYEVSPHEEFVDCGPYIKKSFSERQREAFDNLEVLPIKFCPVGEHSVKDECVTDNPVKKKRRLADEWIGSANMACPQGMHGELVKYGYYVSGNLTGRNITKAECVYDPADETSGCSRLLLAVLLGHYNVSDLGEGQRIVSTSQQPVEMETAPSKIGDPLRMTCVIPFPDGSCAYAKDEDKKENKMLLRKSKIWKLTTEHNTWWIAADTQNEAEQWWKEDMKTLGTGAPVITSITLWSDDIWVRTESKDSK